MPSYAIHSQSKIDIPSTDDQQEEDVNKTSHHNIIVELKEVKS
jgi:hypothetical protein